MNISKNIKCKLVSIDVLNQLITFDYYGNKFELNFNDFDKEIINKIHNFFVVGHVYTLNNCFNCNKYHNRNLQDNHINNNYKWRSNKKIKPWEIKHTKSKHYTLKRKVFEWIGKQGEWNE